jgi:hypothetical protein
MPLLLAGASFTDHGSRFYRLVARDKSLTRVV